VYENSGGVRYRGIEAEAHLTLGWGFTAVGNASLIRAIFLQSDMTSKIQTTGDTIPYAPSYLALAGVTYQNGPWGGSLLTKFLGTEYQGKNGSADGSNYRVNAYSYTNATATRSFRPVIGSETPAAHGGRQQSVRFRCDHRQLRPLERRTESHQRAG
jgi:iron complex outermembrane receptor protein